MDPAVRLEGRLELTWTNKDRTLLTQEDGSYEWVDRSDHRVSEVRLLSEVASVGDDAEGNNLVIEGDALHGLQALNRLPEYADRYVGKVKLVYIDPPFNTGQAFTQYDDNLEHSVWLTMLRDRLLQIKPLLSPDGSVWVHLDDTEVHRCRSVMDEVFGESCYAGTIGWQKAYAPRNDAKKFSEDLDFVLVYSQSPDWVSNGLPRTAEQNAAYRSTDGDPRRWASGDASGPTKSKNRQHPGIYGFQHPITGEMVYPSRGAGWRFDQETMLAVLNQYAPYETGGEVDVEDRSRWSGLPVGKIRPEVRDLVFAIPEDEATQLGKDRLAAGNWPVLYFTGAGEGGPRVKRYLDEVRDSRVPQTLWTYEEVGHSQTGKREIQALFPDINAFATPKPERLMQRIIHVATSPGDIVLDCFAGSGTTAAVAHKMGRKWVAIELSSETVADFVVPRLTKVVSNEDPGGITTVETPTGGDLPDGVKAGDGRQAALTLGRFLRGGVLEGLDEGVVKAAAKALRDADHTETETLWSGGGGFSVMRVGPSMFEEVDGRVFLAEWATNGRFAEAVAAQFGYPFEPDGIFSGRKGGKRLAVIDGLVNESVVEMVVDRLPEDERVIICGTAVDPDAQGLIASLRPGSTLRQAPHALLDEYRSSGRTRRKARTAAPSRIEERTEGEHV